MTRLLTNRIITPMSFPSKIVMIMLGSCLAGAQELTLEELKTAGALQSSYRKSILPAKAQGRPQADLKTFRARIEPALQKACLECHGPEKQKAKFRIDTLDPDLVHGADAEWWLEVMDVVSNGEMPPKDGPKLAGEDRSRIIEWLSSQIQVASQVHRAEQGHSSFRRMTRYEYNYALQDLLGLESDFAENLPPEAVSEDGFQNSSETLQMTASQYEEYLKVNRDALDRATVQGERPAVWYWGVSAKRASADKFRNLKASASAGKQKQPARKRRRRGGSRGVPAYYKNTETGQTVPATWTYRGAAHAWEPTRERPETPEPSEYVTVLPGGSRLVVELGNRLPDAGTLRVRVRASRVSAEADDVPSLALEFGWQVDQDRRTGMRISQRNLVIDAPPGKPKFYQWGIPLRDISPRNPVRKTDKLGVSDEANPSEYIRLFNASRSRSAEVQVDYVEVLAPLYEQWPPATHAAIFFASENSEDEHAYARQVVTRFMKRAWRRRVTEAEVDRKMEYFASIRPICENSTQAVVETLATVLSSPRFLYLVPSDGSPTTTGETLDPFQLATRLAMFLWCSVPDDQLLELAENGRLSQSDELVRQTKRMLADPRHERFVKHFVRQWLDLGLLDVLNVCEDTYPQFDRDLWAAMKHEPIAFFKEVLQNNRSVMDFLHADYALVNQRLARHYGITNITGSHFQKVSLKSGGIRGGLLTQAGLLAMNSDGTDSDPLKRGIWLLEKILNDPPPPPPPAVPEIDLADPKILKMTLKERMEDHRNQPACYSCHVKIDPWGIALENFDAVGSWRSESRGRKIDASSRLFNQHELAGAHGLKRYLLANRQDQFAQALVHKLTTFALGRPLTFGDRAGVDRLTARLRREGDGLATLVTLIVTSETFQSR